MPSEQVGDEGGSPLRSRGPERRAGAVQGGVPSGPDDAGGAGHYERRNRTERPSRETRVAGTIRAGSRPGAGRGEAEIDARPEPAWSGHPATYGTASDRLEPGAMGLLASLLHRSEHVVEHVLLPGELLGRVRQDLTGAPLAGARWTAPVAGASHRVAPTETEESHEDS